MGEVYMYSQCSLTLIPEPTNYSVNRNDDERRTNFRPCSLQPVHHYLKTDVDKALARVTGGKVYQGAEYGLEYRVFTNQSLILTSYEKLLIL